MALNIVLTSDFKGYWNVSENKFGIDDFELYVQMYQVQILKDLLGCELYDLFIADLLPDADNRDVPQTPIYLDIYNEICSENLTSLCCSCTSHSSYGMIDLLKSMIRYYWLRDQKYKQTVSGTAVMDSENSVIIKSLHYNLTNNINRGIKSYQSIQCYIGDNKTNYETYEGIKKEYSSWI